MRKEENTVDQNDILKYVEPILRFCKKRLNKIQDAEDLASDIILHVLSGMKKYEIKSLDAWVWSIAHMTIISPQKMSGRSALSVLK